MPEDRAIPRSNRKNAAKPAVSSRRQTPWETRDEDVKLMLRFKNGDEAAFEQLVRRNAQKIHTLVYRFLGEATMVEDLTQEVFLRVHRTASSYQPIAKFSTWLYRITANLSFNVLRARRKGRAVQSAAADDGELLDRNVPDKRHEPPYKRMETAELADKIAHAVNALSENQKIAIILNKYEQKSYEEIAEVLDCSTMAVKSLLSRARGNLRKALRRYVQ